MKKILSLILSALIATPLQAAPLTNTQSSQLKEINLLDNPGFESGKLRWTASGGTFTLDTSSNLGYGGASAAWTPSGTQTFCSATVTVPKGIYGAVGKASIAYKGGDSTHYTWAVEDGSSTILQKHLITTSTNFTVDSLTFQIPTSGSLKLCVIASASATIVYLDQMFLGFDDRVQVFGSPEINVITNPNDAGNWYSGANITVATTTTTSDLPLGSAASGVLGQTIPTAIKITRASGTSSVYTRWTMPTALKNRKLKVQWQQHAISGYASGDLTVQVKKNSASDYSGSYTSYVLTTDSSGNTNIPNMDGVFTTYFDADSSDYYELDITAVSGTTALVVGNVIVGPGIQAQGSVVQPSTAWTPTFVGFGTAASVAFEYDRVGEFMNASGVFTTGTATGVAASFTLPNSWNANATGIVGRWWRTNSSGTTRKTGTLFSTAASNTIQFGSDDYTTAADPAAALNGSTVAGNAEVLKIQLSGIVITNIIGSGTTNLAQNDVEYACNTTTTDAADTTAFSNSPAGCTVPSTLTAARSKRARFLTPYSGSTIITLEVQANSSAPWVTFQSDATNGVTPRQLQNSVEYGVSWNYSAGTPTDIDVQFGQYSEPNATTFGGVGRNWSGPNGAGMKWRLKKSQGGQAVGFGNVAPGVSSGLVSATGLTGRTLTSSALPAGYVGEFGVSSVSTNTSMTHNAYVTGATATLTAGTYLVFGVISDLVISANSGDRVFTGLAYNSGGYTDLVQISIFKTDGGTSNDLGGVQTIPYVVSFASTDSSATRTVAVRVQTAVGSSITGTFTSYIFWIRIA